MQKNTETLLYASKEVDLEEEVLKTKYVFLSRHQNAVDNHYIDS
jgi:hypothetical protein